ncbi:MAG TPA: response regulator transcription factor [Dehalococcoidia bacterium]|nr:response regulator transcription factor [Dehalococcoidia bacterium]
MRLKPRILIIDDDHSLIRLTKHILSKEGFDVLTALNGLEGLQKAQKEEPDLVILDIVMPEPDGFQVLELLRQRNNIPVIMLTAEQTIDTSCDALTMGADDYIRKPFSASQLLARVRAKLRRAAVEVS